jgi:hypothetical protein
MGDKNSGSGEMAVVSLVLLLVAAVSGLDNGLVRVPWMGFSTWEVFRATTPAQNAQHSLSGTVNSTGSQY